MTTTNDRDAIQVGQTYWNINLRQCTVLSVSHTEDEAFMGRPTGRTITWYNTTDGLFDASRLSTRRPS
jgi:hypothetical protein